MDTELVGSSLCRATTPRAAEAGAPAAGARSARISLSGFAILPKGLTLFRYIGSGESTLYLEGPQIVCNGTGHVNSHLSLASFENGAPAPALASQFRHEEWAVRRAVRRRFVASGRRASTPRQGVGRQDFVEACGKTTLALKSCTEAHPEYYGALNDDDDGDEDDAPPPK